jgi:MGT family glycosyltransferase
MADVIMCSTPGPGHFIPVRTIAVDLQRRGHRVTILTGADFREAVEAIGATFADVGDAHDDLEAVLAERNAVPRGLPQLEYDMRNFFISWIPQQHRALQDLLAQHEDRSVVVVAENFFWGVAPLMLGAPGARPAAFVGIGVTPLTLTSVDAPPFGMGLPLDSSEEGRARNREAYAYLHGEVFAGAQAMYAEVLAGLGVTQEPPFFLDTTILKADRFLQLSIEELSYRRSDTPEHVRFAGPLPTAEYKGELPAWWSEVETAEKVVAVTQGTVANADFGDLIEPTLEALADLPVLVVAATGREGDVRNVPSNARVATFIPFDQLLPHTDVLVTNGGFGAVQQALRNGTPMVLAGTTEDKLEGNVRTASTGAAIDLAVDRPAVADIRKAVSDVLSEPRYVENARRIAVEYAATDALTTIALTVREFGGDR